MSMLSRVLRYSKYAALGTAGTAGLYMVSYNEWDISSLGVVRMGRTALAVGCIVADYKWSLRNNRGSDEESARKWSEVHERSAKRLLNLCSTNGGVFIKVGQHIGALDYIAPPEYCQTLRVLHSHAPKAPLHEVKQVILADLGRPAEELFSEFDPEPIGAASLAQVHRAVLRETGETVAVKVQHRLVKKHSFVDMGTMDVLVRGVARIFPDFSFLWLADEMKRNLPLELDFVNEGQNAERVQRMFQHLSWLKVPEIHWNVTSPRVLTMNYLEGAQITDKDYVKRHKLNPREISDKISTLYSEMIFVQGYVHCDPHPGNILMRKAADGIEISLLDHGLYTSLPEKFRHDYGNMWLAIVNADVENIKRYGTELGAGDLAPLLACILASRSWESLTEGLTNVKKKQNTKLERERVRKYAQEYFPQIVQVLGKVNREMLLVLKTNDLLRGIETSLGTRGERRSLLNMSRYCIRSVFDERLRAARGLTGLALLHVAQQWALFKISCFQLYLWCWCKLMGPDYR